MFGSMKSGANAYAKIGIETGVLAASPHKLIVMLFDGALTSVRMAQQQMQARNIEGKGKEISKAISIIDDGLRASLNVDAGGDLALSLDSLYEYMCNRLLQANIKNAPEMLEEVYVLLQDLKGAWDAIDPAGQKVAQVEQIQQTEQAQQTQQTQEANTQTQQSSKISGYGNFGLRSNSYASA